MLDIPIRVSTPVGESVVVEKVYRSCLVNFVGSKTYVDLVILEMDDFDVILGMTWLSPNFGSRRVKRVKGTTSRVSKQRLY